MGKSCLKKHRKNKKMTENRARQINKKKKFVADGVFHAELHEFLGRILADSGYGGMEVTSSEAKTEIKINVVQKEENQKDFHRSHNELASLIQKRYGFAEGQVCIKWESIRQKGLCASAQAEMLKTKLLKGVAVRSAALSIINTVMKFGKAVGCEVIVSGKMRVQRAKCMKYKAGYLISTGQPKRDFIDTAVRHCLFKQGVIGVKVKIMVPSGPQGPKSTNNKILPDAVVIHPPKADEQPDFLPHPAQNNTNATVQPEGTF